MDRLQKNLNTWPLTAQYHSSVPNLACKQNGKLRDSSGILFQLLSLEASHPLR